MPFSQWLLSKRIARSAEALERIEIAKARILSVLDTYPVAHQKTLEQKISDQGPVHMRVDPHLITYAIGDMQQLRRIAIHQSPDHPDVPWYSNIGTNAARVRQSLVELSPLYHLVSTTLSNRIGDALEVAIYQSLKQSFQNNRRYHFEGHFRLDRPKNRHGRFEQRKAPLNIGDNSTTKQPDFIQYGHNSGVVCIECKNYREWVYPSKPFIKHHIIRCDELDAIPVMICRRIHYSTLTNFFEPAGIIAHESYYQYFPSDEEETATIARDKRKLGFSDIIATETPNNRSIKFFTNDLPRVVDRMAERWERNRTALVAYANNQIHLAQLYNAIGSRAGGKWVDELADEAQPEDWYPEYDEYEE